MMNLNLRSNRRLVLRILVAAVSLVVISLLTRLFSSQADLGVYICCWGLRFCKFTNQGPEYSAFEDDQHSEKVTAKSGSRLPPLKHGSHEDGSQHILGEEEEVAVIKSVPYDMNEVPEHMRTKVTSYVKSILDPYDSTFTILRCPRFKTKRYAHLQVPVGEKSLVYFFALDLRQVVDLLPRLLGSIVEAIRFLGPENCAISIVEGNSDDGTWEVLAVLKSKLEALGVTSFILKEQIDPSKDNRIGNLARLRSLALEPLRNSRNSTARSLGLVGSTSKFADDAAVIFLNDVAACPEDICKCFQRSRSQSLGEKLRSSLCDMLGESS